MNERKALLDAIEIVSVAERSVLHDENGSWEFLFSVNQRLQDRLAELRSLRKNKVTREWEFVA